MAKEYTFSEDLFSDLHKDALGYRPRQDSSLAWDFFNGSDDDKQSIWDFLIEQMVARQAEEADYERMAVEAFEARIAHVIESGAGDRDTAIRWLYQSEAPESRESHTQDYEHFLYNQGVLFSDESKDYLSALEV